MLTISPPAVSAAGGGAEAAEAEAHGGALLWAQHPHPVGATARAPKKAPRAAAPTEAAAGSRGTGRAPAPRPEGREKARAEGGGNGRCGHRRACERPRAAPAATALQPKSGEGLRARRGAMCTAGGRGASACAGVDCDRHRAPRHTVLHDVFKRRRLGGMWARGRGCACLPDETTDCRAGG
eukprot:scaffold34198_cov79-Isochrysis_galbana.AAC.1